MGIFSSEYEYELLELHQRTYQKMLELAEQRISKPVFIQKCNVNKYYDGVSAGTLERYEELGLKRHQPVEKGLVFYHTRELDRFMLSN